MLMASDPASMKPSNRMRRRSVMAAEAATQMTANR